MTSDNSGFKAAEVKPPANTGGSAAPDTGGVASSRPQFTNLRLNQVKDMVSGANPGEVHNVAEGWNKVRVSLVGEDWNSGIKKHFDDAVTKVLQSWHGHSAEQFAVAAQKISENFANLAPYPHNASHVMKQIGDNLQKVKTAVESVEEPSWLESKADRLADLAGSGSGKAGIILGPVGGAAAKMLGAGDGRDDSGLNADLQNPNTSIYDAMAKNRGNLSLDRERELQAAHYMEQLATTYRAGTKAMASPRVEDDRIKPPEQPTDGGGALPVIAPFGPKPSSPNPGGGGGKVPGLTGSGIATPPSMEAPRPNGIDGGIGSIPKSPAPNVGTGLDSLGGGGGGLGGGGSALSGGGAGGGGLGAGGLGAGGGAGSGAGGGSASGIGGGIGGGMAGGVAGRGGGAGAGAGARGGRAGMPGMGGGAGAGKGAGAKGAGGGRGALARQKGGVVGGKGGKLGGAGQGGSGLHRSSGGTQKGATGGRRPAGMSGAPGAHGGKGKDNKGENGQRPDYLVEDEETWTSERNVAPKVIE
ncbi:hypothetical protein ACIQNI_05455 [Streptomyces sp. NPDC091266]|uniref:hypothetical protein n=1 Tax=Streptomyces sp. NPDC091266 TaxID=3365978 RepID=UPI0037F13C25